MGSVREKGASRDHIPVNINGIEHKSCEDEAGIYKKGGLSCCTDCPTQG